MKNSKQNALRWLREAENTLRQVQHAIDQKDYNVACFLAEQSAQKSLKAVLYGDGSRFVNIHSVAELIKNVGIKHPNFMELIGRGAKLDQYYLSTRYPDAVAEPAIPSELFDKNQAEEAMEIAKEIFQKSKSVIL